jgi:hypothetical protein
LNRRRHSARRCQRSERGTRPIRARAVVRVEGSTVPTGTRSPARVMLRGHAHRHVHAHRRNRRIAFAQRELHADARAKHRHESERNQRAQQQAGQHQGYPPICASATPADQLPSYLFGGWTVPIGQRREEHRSAVSHSLAPGPLSYPTLSRSARDRHMARRPCD